MHPAPPYHACERCGAIAPTKNAYFIRHIGLVVMFLHSHIRGQMCRRCIDSAFLTNTAITGLFGWWGIISFFVTCVALPVNIIQYLMALSLPKGDHVPIAAAGPGLGGPAPHGAMGASYAAGPEGAASFAPNEAPIAAAPRKPSKVPYVIAAVILAPIALCCVGFGGLTAYGGVQSSQLRAVGDACRGNGVASAAAYSPGGAVRAAAFNDDGSGQPTINYELLDHPLETSDADEVQLVLCAAPEEETEIEVCSYTTPSGQATIERRRYERRVRLVVAQTGEELASETLQGGEPAGCPLETDFYNPAIPIRYDGARLTSSDYTAFVERHAAP